MLPYSYYTLFQSNAIQKDQGIDAGIAYINSTYADKYSSGANTPSDTMHHVGNSDNEPPVTMHYIEDSDNAPETEGKKKITALLPDSLHRRLSLHAAVTGSSINQIIATLIQNHVPDYQISVKG